MRRISKWIVVVAVVAAAGTGACSTDQPAVCDSFDAVRSSIDQIRDANVGENGLSQLSAGLTQFKDDLTQLATDARTQFPAEIQAVQAAADQLSASVTTARAAPDVASLAAVRQPLIVLQSSVQNLGNAMSGTC